MKSKSLSLLPICVFLFALKLAPMPKAQTTPTLPYFASINLLSNREISLSLTGQVALTHQVQVSTNLAQWQNWMTFVFPGSGALQQTDSAAPFAINRYLRVAQPAETNLLTGDNFPTEDGEIVIHPVNHASFVMKWKDLVIYNDPVGGASPYQSFPRADLILVSHDHSDHYDATTLNAVRKTNSIIITPRAVYNTLPTALKSLTTVLTNGSSTSALGLQIDAIPAYNGNHPKGTGNGYILTVGGKHVYMTGDTGNITEMRALTNIDVAFVCMNVPFTMSIPDALTALRAFRPKVVYPYHYRNQDGTLTDLNSLKRQLGVDPGVEIRVRKWY